MGDDRTRDLLLGTKTATITGRVTGSGGQPLANALPAHGNMTGVNTVAISPDGRYIAAGYADSVIRVFESTTPSQPRMSLDGPANNSTISQPFVTGGWAADLGALDGVGVDAIHVWAFPVVNGVIGAGQFVDAATLSGARGDVGAAFGTQFTNSGFNFLMTG